MKTIKYFCFVLLLFGFVMNFSGCKDDTEPFDQCKDKEIASAEFIMGQRFMREDTVVNADTVLAKRIIVFRAKNEYQHYEWRIGTDPRVFTTREVALFFDEVFQPLTIDVSLKVRDTFLEKCFGEAGTDSVMRKLTLVHSLSSRVFGKYEGYLENDPSDTFIVEVSYCQPGTFNYSICTKNINKGCVNDDTPPRQVPPIECVVTYKNMRMHQREVLFDECFDPEGWLFFGDTLNDVIIEYSARDMSGPQGSRKHYRFIGKRVE